jgi:enamine deaminase RidA (YjgF/YER057c/UK114 family)
MKARPIIPPKFGAPLGMYSHGVIAPAGDLVVVAGQVGTRPDGSLAGEDVGAQTRQALENVQTVLQAAGCSMRDVIRFQTFLTSAEDLPGFMKARGEAFPAYFSGGAYPPNTLLVVSRLVLPALRVEIEAMAVRPRRAASSPRPTAPKARATRRSPGGARRRR